MKRVIGLVFMSCAASWFASEALAAPAVGTSKASAGKPAPTASARATATKAAGREAGRQAAMAALAPADEYFGPLKVSIIGISNTMRDLGRRYDVNHDIGSQTFASAQLTERAIRDWEKRYPHDDQLPRAVYFLQRLYTKVLTQSSRDRAHVTALWLFADFSRSPQARQLKKTLAVEHLAALPPPSTPAPLYQSVFGPAYSSQFALPVSAAAGSSAARPSAAPSPPATGSPAAEAPAVPAASPSRLP